MKYGRVLAPLTFVAALAACSGSLGGGQSTLPGGPTAPIAQVTQPAATASPLSAANVASVGEGATGPQPLPTIAGYGGSVTFAKPAVASTPNPKVSPTPSNPTSIGITAAIVEPTDAPKFDPVTESKKHRLIGSRKENPNALKPLLFITLLATNDVTFDAYPKFEIDVPRDIVTKYREGEFALALYDPATKDKRYRLAVAERDYATPAPGARPALAASSAPAPTPTSTPTPRPSGLVPRGAPAPGVAAPLPQATLPPMRVAFAGTAAPLALKANRPVVFALYAIPATPSPAPIPSAKPSPKPSATASVVPTSAASTGALAPASSAPASAAPSP